MNRKLIRNLKEIVLVLLHRHSKVSLQHKNRVIVELLENSLIPYKYQQENLQDRIEKYRYHLLFKIKLVLPKNTNKSYRTPWQLMQTTSILSFHCKRRNRLRLSPLALPIVAVLTSALEKTTASDSSSKPLRIGSPRLLWV